MADTNEAQLLSELLREIAREDAHADAAHLEMRVMEAVEASASAHLMQPSFGATALMRWGIAAAVAAAILGPAVFWLKTQVPQQNTSLKVDATEEVVAQANAGGQAKSKGPAKAGHYVLLPRTGRIAKSAVPRSAPAAESAIARSPITPIAPIAPTTQLLDEFVPLMPMTEQELTGPFQLVRVQMPRASLGALRSPLEYPNELVEADVLLGEDGMARAIRVSTGGSVYPWRSR